MEAKKDPEGLDNWLSSGLSESLDEVSPTDKSPLDDLQNAVSNDSRHYGRDIDLVPVARYQRSQLISLAVAVALLLIGMGLNIMMGDSDSMIVFMAPIVLVFLVNLIWAIVCKFRLAIALEKVGATSYWLFEFFGRKTNAKATQLLKKHGYKVGIFGVNPMVVKEAQAARIHRNLSS